MTIGRQLACLFFLFFLSSASQLSCSEELNEGPADAADAGVDAGADGADAPADQEPADGGDGAADGEPDGSDPGADPLPDGGDEAGDEVDDGGGDLEPPDGGDPGDDADDGGDAAGDPGDPGTFLVLTINLKHPLTGLDEARQRLQLVADAIIDRQPDVVALQEVIKDGEEPSFAEQLAVLTGYEWIWEYTFTVPFLFNEGLGILSRWPVVWSDSESLPHLDLIIFTRRILGARVASPHGEIQLFCTHMTTDSDESVKADQALAVFEFISSHPSTLPGFFAGDLNAEPDSLAMRFLRGEAEYQGVNGNLIDGWMAVNPDDDGFTIPSGGPNRRIDYIYLVPGSEQAADAVSCEVMFAEPVGDVYASDHLGVLCRFSLP